MPQLRPRKGHQGILRPTRRQVPVMTRQGRMRAQKPKQTLGGRGRDRVTSQLVGKTNLRLCIQRRLGGIGDVLMTTPVVKALKSRYPEAELTYATDPQYYHGDLFRILEGNPYIDKLVDFRTVNQASYHLFVDLTGICPPYERPGNPPINRIDLFARHVGIRLDDPLPDYVLTGEEKAWAQTILEKWFGNGNHKVVVIHTASVDQRRTWPIKNYVQMLHELTEQRAELRFVILDQNRQKENWAIKNCVNASSYGIRQVAALIWAADLFVGPDSGPLHIAGALEKEIVSIFGSTDPAARINYYDGAVAVESGMPCAPCFLPGELISTTNKIQIVEDIAVGDQLFGRHGELVQTGQLHERFFDGTCVELGVCGTNIPIRVTDNHEFDICLRGHKRKVHRKQLVDVNQLVSKRADEIRKDDYLVMPRPQYSSHSHFAPVCAGTLDGPVQFTCDFYEFLGLYLAEGHLTTNSTGRGYPYGGSRFILGAHESLIANRLQDLSSELFQYQPIKTDRTNIDNTHWWSIHSAGLAELLNTICHENGTTCREKRIAYWYMPDTVDKQVACLKGFALGDGYLDFKGDLVLSTTSVDLAAQLRDLVFAAGGYTGFYKRVRNTNYKKDAVIYRIVIPTKILPSGDRYNDICRAAEAIPYSVPTHAFSLPDKILTPVREVKHFHYTGSVYNIGIDTPEHVFNLANGVNTHNCWYAGCPSNLQCMRDISVAEVSKAILQKIDKSLPVELSQEYRVKLVTDSSCTLEENCIANAMQIGLSTAGMNVVLNPPDHTKHDLVIDIVRASGITIPLQGKPPTARLNLCMPLMFENKLSRSATQRLSSTYDGLLCFGGAAIKTIREAGISSPINSIAYPVISRPRQQPKLNHLVSVVHQITAENLTMLVQAIELYEAQNNTQLELTINTSDEESIQLAHKILKSHPRITVRWVDNIKMYNSLWETAAIFIDVNGFSQGWFVADAITRGLAVLVGDYDTLSSLPDSLLYKVPCLAEKPLLSSDDGKYLGSYATHNPDDIVDGLTTLITLYNHDRREKQERLKYVLEMSHKKSFGRIASILHRKLKK